MAAARTGVRGLGTDELQAIRDGLAAGRKPRVMFTASAGQIAGQLGQVVALTDPAVSDEWVVVRFGRDELPFAPGDLQVAPKGAAARKAAPPPAASPPSRPEPEFVIDKPVGPARGGRSGSSGGRGGAAVTDESGSGKGSGGGRRSVGGRDSDAGAVGGPSQTGAGTVPAGGNGRTGAATSSEGGSSPAVVSNGKPAGSGGNAPAPAPRKASSRPAKPKPPPGLTVTLAYTDGEWTIAANQGSKALAKPYVVRPAEAMRMVALVDVPGVQEAVEQIVAAERAEVEQQAERLRAELAEIEARLQELRDAS
ncbi:hypothetical protein [Actinoplanes sp. NPDC049681]|uniref:hypothetical protein n=1 Tax=Actinoplanes sp. NPDC049681 TaxID=3363905 RepID=UPI00379F89D3